MVKTVPTAFALLAALLTLPAEAMDFGIVETSGGQRAVLATGPIDEGDGRTLAHALARVPRDVHGTKELYLDSPGGSVVDAFKMAQVIDQVGVTTIVPAKATCASACASVVFIAGKYRTVDKGGQLLIHSCYDARNGRKMDECDAVIAALAQQQGISGGAMMAFQEVAPGPNTGVLFTADDAACFGLTLAPGKAALGDKAPCIQAVLHPKAKKKKK